MLGLSAALLSLIASSPYPGVSVDSGEYLAVADGLRQGHGLTMPYAGYDEAFRVLEPGERVPMTQFPPLYPSVLAATGLSLLDAVRALAALVFAAFVCLGAYLVWRETTSLPATTLAGALLVGPDLLAVHAMAWSEQLMLVPLLGALLYAVRYAERRSRWDLIGMGACASAASMARFAGVSAIFACTVVVFSKSAGPRGPRLLRAGALAGVSLVPTIAWFVHNSIATGVPSEKQAAWHPPSLQVFGQAAQSIGGWVVPWRPVTMAAGVAMIVVGALAAVRGRRRLAELRNGKPISSCIVFGLSYAAFLLVARTVLDQNIPFDTRLLAPLLALTAIGACCVTFPSGRPFLRGGAAVLSLLALASVARSTILAVRFSDTTIAAYTSADWRSSELLAYATSLPRSALLITNAPDPLWLWDRRSPQILPPRSSLYSGEPNANYSLQLRAVLAATRCRRAVVIFFSQPTRKPPRDIDPVIVHDLKLEEPREYADGAAFEVDEPPCA